MGVIYNHDMVLSAYHDEGGKRLSCFVKTRFSIVLLMCKEIKENHKAIARTTTAAKLDKRKESGHSRKACDDDGEKTNGQLTRAVENDLKDDEF